MPGFSDIMGAVGSVGFPIVVAVLFFLMMARQLDFQNTLIRSLTMETSKQTEAIAQLTAEIRRITSNVHHVQVD